MTNDGANTLVYDAENRMLTSTGSAAGAYTYDGNNLRVKKVFGSTTTVYLFSGSKVIAEYVNGAAPSVPTREYIYSGGTLLAKIEAGTTKYYHRDHLSNRLVTDSSGNVSAQIGHYPYGESWYNSTGDKLIFTSYERDSESGNDYALARYYISRLGRFSSPDKMSGSAANPQSLNRYSYVLNNPGNLVDPSGQCGEDFDAKHRRKRLYWGEGGRSLPVDGFEAAFGQEVSIYDCFGDGGGGSGGEGGTPDPPTSDENDPPPFIIYKDNPWPENPEPDPGPPPLDNPYFDDPSNSPPLIIGNLLDNREALTKQFVENAKKLCHLIALKQVFGKMGATFNESTRPNTFEGGHLNVFYSAQVSGGQSNQIQGIVNTNSLVPPGSRIGVTINETSWSLHVNDLDPASNGGILSMRVHLDVANPNQGLIGMAKHVAVDFIGGHQPGADLDPLCF